MCQEFYYVLCKNFLIFGVDTISNPILQMSKLRLRKADLAQITLLEYVRARIRNKG